jgi:hypothetical protein
LDKKRRSCIVDATTEIGRDIARIFTGFLTREFGEDVFKVERVANNKATTPLSKGTEEVQGHNETQSKC